MALENTSYWKPNCMGQCYLLIFAATSFQNCFFEIPNSLFLLQLFYNLSPRSLVYMSNFKVGKLMRRAAVSTVTFTIQSCGN